MRREPLLSIRETAHQSLVRLTRRIGRLVPGLFFDARGYGRIRDAFAAPTVTADDFTVDPAHPPLSDLQIEAAARALMRFGIVVLRDYFSSALIDEARKEADELAQRINAAIAVPSNSGEIGNMPWQVGYTKLHSYGEIASQDRPIANLRSRERGTVNGGLIDVYAVEKVAQEMDLSALSRCCELLASQSIARILGLVSSRQLAHFNLLRNDSVTMTRRLHVDNLHEFYKVFLYISDVRELGDGPYAYVPGTHRRLDLLRREARLNCLGGRQECDSFAFEGFEQPIFGPGGTVIISCQSGVHRGLPQHEGASRTVLVSNYRH